ncbi:unnamed protein product [Cuscuta epithymum]|uniref:RNase H type-1 domain-containing protein n=1 Tax=Cuscuta epithymum TaxID=186058 RepID=A0AAV0F572_9ASTE|nr:unnamed protein product [Cuscuta epithymum]
MEEWINLLQQKLLGTISSPGRNPQGNEDKKKEVIRIEEEVGSQIISDEERDKRNPKIWIKKCLKYFCNVEYNQRLDHDCVITFIHPRVNRAAEYLAHRSVSIHTTTHHFNHCVGILKFDAVSYPYVFDPE